MHESPYLWGAVHKRRFIVKIVGSGQCFSSDLIVKTGVRIQESEEQRLTSVFIPGGGENIAMSIYRENASAPA